MTTVEKRAAEHDRLGSELLGQVADPMKNVLSRFEDVRKSHGEYAAKLEKERDAAYSEHVLLKEPTLVSDGRLSDPQAFERPI